MNKFAGTLAVSAIAVMNITVLAANYYSRTDMVFGWLLYAVLLLCLAGLIMMRLVDRRQSELLDSFGEKVKWDEETIRGYQAELAESNRMFELIAENTADYIWTTDLDLNFTYKSPAMERIYGHVEDEADFRPLSEILPPVSLKLAMESFESAMELERTGHPDADNVVVLELEDNTRDGRQIWIENTMRLLRDENNVAIGVIGITRDITERKRRDEELRFLSYHDSLTGLYNRRFFEEEMKRLDTPRNYPISIVIGDVNGLKIINDAFGHDEGDKLLCLIAATIKSCCRADDIIARWGGDEFIILLPKTGQKEAKDIIGRIKELQSVETISSIRVSASFGWNTKEQEDQDMSELLKQAENFMYRNKNLESSTVRSNIIDTVIGTLHEKNPREELHSKRVAMLSERIGAAIKLSDLDLSNLRIAGLLHDIGKIGIDESILNKPGSLTADEWEIIKNHPEIGKRIVSSSYELTELANAILCHHERWDGGGYPNGIIGGEIPLESRIICIADAYDAMTSERSYKSKLSREEALAEVAKNAGIQFDPMVAEAFASEILSDPDLD